jgi:hypothetical protein
MEEIILDILRNIFKLDSVDKDISQNNCDKWDSMNHLNLVVELESKFDIYLEPEEIAKMKNFEEIARVISSKI